jgi:hypothetical protein
MKKREREWPVCLFIRVSSSVIRHFSHEPFAGK